MVTAVSHQTIFKEPEEISLQPLVDGVIVLVIVSAVSP